MYNSVIIHSLVFLGIEIHSQSRKSAQSVLKLFATENQEREHDGKNEEGEREIKCINLVSTRGLLVKNVCF